MRLVIPLGVLLVAGALWWALQPATPSTRPRGATAASVASADSPPQPDAPVHRPDERAAPPSTRKPAPPAVDERGDAAREARQRAIAERVKAKAEASAILQKLAQKAPATKAPAMTADAVKFAIDQAKPGIANCYEQALEKTPDLAGKLVVRFTVHAQDGVGTLRDAEIVEDGPDNPFLGMCALGAIAKVEFEADADGVITVNYPFRLAPKADKE